MALATSVIDEKPKIEEIDSDEDVPDLEPAQNGDFPAQSTQEMEALMKEYEKHVGKERNVTKAEKKAKKAISKLGMVAVPGFTRVTFKRKDTIFAISQPDVYKGPDGSYIVFGNAKFEDPAAQARAAAANSIQNEAKAAKPEEVKDTTDTNEEPVDATGLDEKDIELVMKQADVSRNAAVKALIENSNDVVNSIMALTS